MGNAGLYLAQNFPDYLRIRITGMRITEGPVYMPFLTGRLTLCIEPAGLGMYVYRCDCLWFI